MGIASEILTLLQDIKAALNQNQPDKLMTMKQVADMFEVGESTFMQQIACNADFPTPVYVTEGQKGRRWVRADVVNFIRSGGFAGKKKVGRPRKVVHSSGAH